MSVHSRNPSSIRRAFLRRALPRKLRAALMALPLLGGLPGIARAQEACLKGCAYPPYPGLAFTLGDGFVAKGGEEVKVTHMGFLGSVYNNDGITPRKVGVPNYIGELSVIDPVTGTEKFLFRNQGDWVTHANDSGKVINLGVYPKGAPLVFKYVNVDGKESSYKTFPRYSGDNVAGTYDFNADPVLRNLAINGKPKPVSGGSWNWEGKNYNLWCVAADVPGTGEKQFQFEDADDRIFNDIVFRVSGVALVSETHQLEAPLIAGTEGTDGHYKVTLSHPAGAVNQGATIFYTLDGSTPAFDSTGTPLGTTRIYSGPLDIGRTTTLKAKAWKAGTTNSNGSITRYRSSPMSEATFSVVQQTKLSAPKANPPGGGLAGPTAITLTQAEGARIFYRLCDVGAPCPDPDATSTPYAGPFTLSSPKLLKAIAIQAPYLNSDVSSFTYSQLHRLTEAWYLDRNGDGSIDAAKIRFDGAPSGFPQSLALEDPFTPGRKKEIGVASQRWDSSDPTLLWADFSTDPFRAGTAFEAGPFGFLAPGNPGFASQSFTIRDGVGPIALSAEAVITLDHGGSGSMVVRFSEPLSSPGVDGALPYHVKRGAEDLTARLRVSSVEPLGGNAWRYSFGSDVFPMPGDSLKASPLAKDPLGNSANMSYYIPVGGRLPEVEVILDVAGGGCGRGMALSFSTPLAIPLSVVPARPAQTIGGCPQDIGAVDCLDCRTGEWKRADPRRPEAGGFPAGPEIQVTTSVPFAFDLAYYSTLGEFVNRARGTVTADMLASVAVDGKGARKVGLRWYPVSEKGAQAATGAYIIRGTLTPKPEIVKAAETASAGKPIPALWGASTPRKVDVRFGYMRD